MDPSMLGALTAPISVFTTMLPPLREVRRADWDSEMAEDVHTGIVMATIAIVSAGGVVSIVQKSVGPVLLAGTMAAVMAIVYEATLQRKGEVL